MPSSITQRELRGADIAMVRAQLGREPSTPFVVIARCTGGHPLVIRNAPLDARGDPFPTTYWLTCPAAVRAVARLESAGWIARLNERSDGDPGFRADVERAHAAYARDRGQDLAAARSWGGVAGTRVGVKCLHAHYAYHLAGGEDPVGAWVAEHLGVVHPEQPAGRVAAIDQGTNSCRLLVLEPREGDEPPVELARDMVITRLGRGVDRTGRLDLDALAATVEVLAVFGRRARALGAERIRVAATSAVRDAANREAFVHAVREHVGSEPEIISGEQEAALSFLGATYGLDPASAPGPYLVQDIGGGSTEFVVGPRPGMVDRGVSTQMGSVRLTERLVRHDPPSAGDLAALREEIEAVLDEALAELDPGRIGTVVAVAGTATTLRSIALDLDRYDPDRIHRTWLGRAEVDALLDRLAGMTNEERAALPTMAPGRGDVIVAGAVILSATMARLGVSRVLVSETDILDGLAFELLGIR